LHYWLFGKFKDLPAENNFFGIFMKDETLGLAVNTCIILGKFFTQEYIQDKMRLNNR